MSSQHERNAVRPGQGGFTLIELTVALGVTTIVMLGILALFDFNNKLTRIQTNVADMQQSMRIAQYDMVRMLRVAGRGGLTSTLPGQVYPTGTGVSILSGASVGTNTYLVPGDTSSPKLLQGTDVLTLRGAFSTPIYQVKYADAASFVPTGPGAPTPTNATGGSVLICTRAPTGVDQDLSTLTGLIDAAQLSPSSARKEAIILVSPQSDGIYAVVQLDPATSSKFATSPSCLGGSGVILTFISDRTQTLVSQYRNLYPAPVGANLPAALTKVAFVAVLEEYRFYLREDHSIQGNTSSDLTPVLSRARFYPGTNLPYAGDVASMSQDVADGVLDLQFTLGLDVNNDGQVTESTTNPATDEWLGNSAGEAPIAGGLKFIRVSTLTRTNRPDNKYTAPDLPRIEDHVYSLSDPADRVNGTNARKYRRRLFQTIANVRNLTT